MEQFFLRRSQNRRSRLAYTQNIAYVLHAEEDVNEPQLADFVSPEFERLCQRALRSLYPEETITDVGQWWYQDHEIDVVGLTTRSTLIAGECKFQTSPVGYETLGMLEGHVEELRWSPADGGERRCEYALFSRSGFTDAVEAAREDRDDLRLFNCADVVDAL